MFTDMAFELPWERYRDSNIVMHGWNEMVYDQNNWIGLNMLGKRMQRDKWGGKVYLENAYYLHGYWGILVDRYEEMIHNYHPGFHDHRWPLEGVEKWAMGTVHFGCSGTHVSKGED
ncbi:hypothetical protein Nepgr_010150 [Nepenthes gracilis]|uniref:Uncharacterized protein n=1 Tax=Nepenthes gracilis TaxID=150966 RepID=A0AAD3XL22_NEPGR|nr:hypothetical protein Nepgr_010150 [Nepenthes gracilis]